MVQTLSQIKAMLASRSLRPRRRFGQNFLHEHAKLDQILRAAELQPGETVLEVGPGTGALTERLLETGCRVVAVEIDRDLVELLRDRIGPDHDRWHLIQADVMADKHHLNEQVIAAIGGPDHPFKMVANLPYNIASPLLVTLATDYPAMPLALAMVQREVADRLTASPGGGDYGPLGIIVQTMCHVQRIIDLPATCFWPRPQVSSAVVRMTRRDRPLTDDPRALRDIVHRLFTQRRKQVGSILGRHIQLPADIDPHQRPEQLTIDQLVALARCDLS